MLSPITPVGPEVIEVLGATRSTVNDRLAGVGSRLPEGSVARTSNVCDPSPNGAVVRGEVHAANESSSTRHSNVEPGSDELKPNVGVLSFVGPTGPVAIVVSGGARSSVLSSTATPPLASSRADW